MQYRLHRNLFLDAITKLQVISADQFMPLPVMLLSHVQSPDLMCRARIICVRRGVCGDQAARLCMCAHAGCAATGVHLPRTLWEYRKEFPVRASVYFSGLLAAPRLTVLWLLVSEREMVQRVHNAAVARLQIILGEPRGSSVQVHGCLAYGGSQAARCSCMSALELSDLT